ncbi:MAG: NfeD family protein [Rothia sp. (in: high G+C Gram-positive bacteria)]|nr:NfeD family protein [Rothia sp. (in: high G+C Gram-positive bacteria)]
MIDWFTQNLWAFWLTAALILAIIEILLLDFVFLMMGLAALSVAASTPFIDSFVWQVVLFAVISIALLLGLRPPLIRRFHQSSPDIAMNSDGLIGQEALVTQTVTDQTGLARVAGDTWTARPEDSQQVLPEGSKATVVAIRGATAYLTPLSRN